MKKCGIPSYNVGVCDLEWGHEGRMHSNAGDGFYARDYDEEHQRRQTEKMLIVDSTAKPLPKSACLMDGAYQQVTTLTMPEMEEWPEHIRWRGRIFTIYHMTRAVSPSEDANRQQYYREITLWDAKV